MMTEPTMTTWKIDVNMDDLVIPSLNVNYLGGEALGRANKKLEVKLLSVK